MKRFVLCLELLFRKSIVDRLYRWLSDYYLRGYLLSAKEELGKRYHFIKRCAVYSIRGLNNEVRIMELEKSLMI